MDLVPYLSLGSAVAALALAAYFFGVVKRASPGNPPPRTSWAQCARLHIDAYRLACST